MELNILRSYLTHSELHRRVLSGYAGPYSLGIGKDPQRGTPVLILQVTGAPNQSFPHEVRLGGEIVPVLVRTDFKVPTPLRVS